MKNWLKNHSLGLVMFALFFIFLVGQSLAGQRHYNEEQQSHGQSEVTYVAYVTSGDFIESVFENWESEFLQMGMYVILTAFLFHKGSAESKKNHGEQSRRQDAKKFYQLKCALAGSAWRLGAKAL